MAFEANSLVIFTRVTCTISDMTSEGFKFSDDKLGRRGGNILVGYQRLLGIFVYDKYVSIRSTIPGLFASIERAGSHVNKGKNALQSKVPMTRKDE